MNYFLLAVFALVLIWGIFFWGDPISFNLVPRARAPVQQQDSIREQIVQVLEQQVRPSATIKETQLELELARTPEEQSQGLSQRELLPENTAMLFVYEEPTIPGFWMKDMNFALDMIWVDQNNAIIAVSENVAPESYPEIFFPPSLVKYVLEVNAGWAQAHGVTVGDTVVFNGVF
ncbi:MAG TPA: DUF192 domain-containing protein [Candidatus Paceibacterota bacterium]|nr:DUF192 domain-containing protein [Candidatus Paceibacterota bacterium]